MKKYIPVATHGNNVQLTEPWEGHDTDDVVYLVSDVDMQISQLKKALRDLASVPAVLTVLGDNHTTGCRCPLCVARELTR